MRIAFIHNNAKTGASVHALMLGRRLQEKMDVTFLLEELRPDGLDFSAIRDVRLFPYTREQQARRKEKWPLHVSLMVRFRKSLFKLGCLRWADKCSFFWKPFHAWEKKWYQKRMPLPDGLIHYLEKQDQNYDCYIVMGNYNSIPFLLKERYARKTILIPLVHNEKSQFILSAHAITRKYPFLAYNTEAEKSLAEKIHGKTRHSDIIGSGIESIETNEERWQKFKKTNEIPDTYLLYVGRITPRKVGDLLPYFQRFKGEHLDLKYKLVIVGENDVKDYLADDRIMYMGFVGDTCKADLIHHATVVINPSSVESLSLIVLESMDAKVPVLVNGKCDVLKQHCQTSGGGYYYLNYNMFKNHLSHLLEDIPLRRAMGEKGQKYQKEHYDWDIIIAKTERAIEKIAGANSGIA